MEGLVTEPAAPRGTSHGMQPAQCPVLVLDDDAVTLRIMGGVLRTAGYSCVTARSAHEALALLDEHADIALVVSDIFMPQMDGLEFLRQLRGMRTPGTLPKVLFLTGYPSLDKAVAALRLGAADFLVKPLKPRELLDAVSRACEDMHAQRLGVIPQDASVESLAQQAEALAYRLRHLSQPPSPAPGPAPAVAPLTPQSASHANVLDAIEHLRRLRRDEGSPLGRLDDLAWELLMETLRWERRGRRVSVSGLSLSVEGASSTTALRRINELVAQGHLLRTPDPADARRDFVVVSAAARAALEHYLAIAAGYLHLPMD